MYISAMVGEPYIQPIVQTDTDKPPSRRSHRSIAGLISRMSGRHQAQRSTSEPIRAGNRVNTVRTSLGLDSIVHTPPHWACKQQLISLKQDIDLGGRVEHDQQALAMRNHMNVGCGLATRAMHIHIMYRW